MRSPGLRRLSPVFLSACALFAGCSDSDPDSGPSPEADAAVTDAAPTPDAAAEPDAAPMPDAAAPAPCTLIEDGPGPDGPLTLRVEEVARGLEVPWGLGFLPNGDLLVTERPGRLRLIRDGQLLDDPLVTVEVADVDVQFGFEGGLLGVLIHPDFAQNRQFYLYFTATKADDTVVNRVLAYTLSEDGLAAALDHVVLDDVPAGGHHQGGRMQISPDGKLFVGVGAYEPALAQDPASVAGKLLRLNLDGSIPDDNPTPGSAVFASGIRNTQGYDWFDDDTLLVMDHGPSGIELGQPDLRGHDEFNIVRAGDNLGWPRVYGCDEAEGLTAPRLVWKTAVPPAGAAIYTGSAIPEWRGSFMMASLGVSVVGPTHGHHLHRIALDPADPAQVTAREVYLRGTYGRLRTVAMGLDGHLYVTTSNCDGRGSCPPEGDRILRIVGTE